MIKQIEQYQANKQENIKKNEEDVDETVSVDSDPASDEQYEPDLSLDAELDGEKIEAVNKLGNLIGAQRIITQGPYNELSDRSKRDKVVVGRKIFHFFTGIMGPGAEKDFGSKVCSIYQPKEQPEKKPVSAIIEAVAEQYQRATDKITKQIILAPLAATCSFNEVKKKIPGLSYFLFNKARKCFIEEDIPEDLPRTFHRYSEEKIRVFVEFFTGPDCMVLLPYGGTSVKLSNGQKLDVAANMRMQSHKQIIRMFRIKMDEEGRKDEMLPLSTMYAILEHCHAKKSKKLTCVDYFLAAAIDGFGVLTEIVDYWLTTEDLSVEESKSIKNGLKIGQEYLQTDFSIHLKQHSEVISHCLQHALGDPENDEFTTECDQHFTVCPKCESLTILLNDMKHRIEKKVSNCKKEECQELEEFEFKEIEIDYAVFNVLELRSHIVRSKLSEMERGKDLSELDETKAYVTLDFAHKLLPTKFRETQKDFFGKDGMFNHITHVQTVNKDGDPVEYAYVHIVKENKQDSTAVIAITLDFLKDLKTKGITSVILRSDNAGCYHSKEVILSLAQLSEESGVQITKFSFSEPQNGKGNSDRIAALVKNKVRRYVRADNNVVDEDQFYDALIFSPGISHTTISLATVTRVDSKIKATALQGIAKYYIFTPKEDGILVHRAANIGKGKLFKYGTTNKKLMTIPKLQKEKEQTFGKINNEEAWRTGKTRNKANPTEECQIFECRYEGCDETFSLYGEYMRHMAFSKHGKINLMRDYAAVIYQDAVKQQKPSTFNLAQALNSERIVENKINDENYPELGWAHRKPKKLPKITKLAEEYVKEKFNEGVADRAKKWKAKKVAVAMKVAKGTNKKQLFKPNEILFPEQINQLFGKFAAEQKKKEKEPSNKKLKTAKELCEERKNELESEEEDLTPCMNQDDDATAISLDNRRINIITRGRRLELANQIEKSSQSLYETT